jgi:hypothetical protein
MDYVNYSGKPLEIREKNLSFLYDLPNSSERGLDPEFIIRIDYDRLLEQSSVFSRNISTLGYLQLSKILRVRSSDVDRILEELFIYSRLKAYFNGMFFNNFNSNEMLGYCFVGDAALFEILISPRYSMTLDDGFIVNLKLKTYSLKELKLLALEAFERFPFLGSFFEDITEESFGNYQLFDDKYERYLNRICEDYYSASHIDKRETGQDFAKDSKRGNLCAVNLSLRSQRTIVHPDNCPIFNSFLFEDKFYYINVGNGHEMRNNPSFVFSKTFNIVLSNLKDTKITQYYDSINKELLDHLVTDEVYNICRVKCIHTSRRIPEPQVKTNPGSLFKVVKDKLGNQEIKLDRILEIIIDSLINSNNLLEWDPGEPENQLLEESKKN